MTCRDVRSFQTEKAEISRLFSQLAISGTYHNWPRKDITFIHVDATA